MERIDRSVNISIKTDIWTKDPIKHGYLHISIDKLKLIFMEITW